MKSHMKFNSTRGFSLIEVLVAVVIMSVGLLALASLQLGLIRSASDTKAQTIAAAVAKDKIEDLRSFRTLAGYRDNIISEAAFPLTDVNGSFGGMNFSRTTSVTRYVYNKGALPGFEVVGNTLTDTAIDALSTGGKVFVPGKDFKRVAVVVAWTNSAGIVSSISLEDIIDNLDPTDIAAITKKTTSGLGPRKVQVKITDPALDSMVIPIALGSGVNSAATNPKPNVVRGVNTVETQFDVLTYSGLNGGTATVQAKVETVVVGCTCDKTEAPATTARGKRPTYWDGTRYTVPLDVANYSPPAAADTQSAAQQSRHCTICCRDHHDPNTTTGATFSPKRVVKTNGIVTTPHSHHLDKLTGAEASATYKEACRVIRSEGIWSVAADLSNDYFGLLATGNGSSALTPIPDSTSVDGTPTVIGGAVARYQNFVLDYMNTRFVTPTPSTGTEQTTYNAVGTPATLAASPPFVLDKPTSISIALVDLVGKWLHSRGLYVDYLETEAVEAITKAKADTVCTTATTTPTVQTAEQVLKQCVLRLLPFTSINLTEIADWSPLSGALSVTNYDYSRSLTDAFPVRGFVTTSTASTATINAVSTTRLTNSGLLDLSFDAISPSDVTPGTDTQAFAVGGGAPASGEGNGEFITAMTMPTGFVGVGTVSYLTLGFSPVGCGADTSTPALNDFKCNVQNGSAVSGLGKTGTMSIIVGGYNTAVAGTDTTSISGCTYAGPTLPASSWPLKNTGSTSYAINTCRDYSVASAQNTTLGANATSIGVYAADTLSAETTKISFANINQTPINTVAVTFNAAATTTSVKRPTSCTYTCELEQGFNCKANKATFFQIPLPATCP